MAQVLSQRGICPPLPKGIRQYLETFLVAVPGEGLLLATSWVETRDAVEHRLAPHNQDQPGPKCQRRCA